ncbi:hypothetical protein GCM10023186_17170 [Hymenobacter koreensis]|uniref:Uncharacterized protein n=1 Tax=Hymenobacter koreensis TaxID=1084523 RepID=A0ABP8IYH7_9BACT
MVLDALTGNESEVIGGSAKADVFDASLCFSCGEPLAWHEQACLAEKVIPEATEAGAAFFSPLKNSVFAFAIGQPVIPGTGVGPCTVIWRGHVKARLRRTGLVHRLNVYQLNDGFWDCYYEAELQAAC